MSWHGSGFMDGDSGFGGGSLGACPVMTLIDANGKRGEGRMRA